MTIFEQKKLKFDSQKNSNLDIRLTLFSRQNPLVSSVLLTSTGADSEEGADISFSDKFISSLKEINSNFVSPIFARERKNSDDMRIEDVKADIENSVKHISP